MEAVVAILAAGLGTYWWQRYRYVRARKAFDDALDGDAEVVLHVAQHEARSRHQPTLTALHLLYGLLQVEAITDALRGTGANTDELEDRVLGELASGSDQQLVMSDDAQLVLARALAGAHAHGRKASVTDLWAHLLRSEVATLFTAHAIDGIGALQRLVHAMPLPALEASGTSDVHIVIRNDDYTTCEFVTDLLVRVFGLPAEAANTAMLQTHTQGKAIVTRLPVAEAHAKIREARALARTHHFPLWIADEPV